MPALGTAEGPALNADSSSSADSGSSTESSLSAGSNTAAGGNTLARSDTLAGEGAKTRPVMRLLVLTPDRIALDERVVSIRFQQPDGWQGILAHHAPYITRLVDGVLMYRLPKERWPQYLVLFGGTLEVRDGEVIVLTTAAERGKTVEELNRLLSERQAEADALAFEAYIEFTKVRAALLRALTDLPDAPEAIR